MRGDELLFAKEFTGNPPMRGDELLFAKESTGESTDAR